MLFGNYSFKNTLIIGSGRILFELVAFGYSILNLNWKHAFAIIRSLFYLLFHINVILRKRYKFKKFEEKRQRYNEKHVKKFCGN